MTIREALRAATARLEQADVPDADVDASYLLASVLKEDTLAMRINGHRALTEEQEKAFDALCDRRAAREPLQYILGETEFMGLTVHVEPGVLSPRADTEILVEKALKVMPPNARVLDIGTGSGCIAISLAKHLPEAEVAAVDISPEALAVAEENARMNQVSVSFLELDILSGGNLSSPIGNFNCIVSNPPYIMNKEKATMEANVLENEPHLALFVPDDDPLLFYRAIARFGQRHLAEGGHLYFEINALCGKETVAMLRQENYTEVELIQDLYGKDRIIKAKI